MNYRGRIIKENYTYFVERNSQDQIWGVDFHSPWSETELQSRNFCSSYSDSKLWTLGKDRSTFVNTQDLFSTKNGRIFHWHLLNMKPDYMSWSMKI